MEENAIIQFFKKIHLTIVDAQHLASRALGAATKSVFLFFMLVFLFSLALSSAVRTIKITQSAPELLVSAAGILKFNSYNMVSPDTLFSVDVWRLKEIGTLISGLSFPQTTAYPIAVSIGTDKVEITQKPFLHVGETALFTNILPDFLKSDTNSVQKFSWDKILPYPNAVIDVSFYETQFSQMRNKFGIFLTIGVLISIEMFSAMLQIWISILIYLLFFGRKLNIFGRIRLILLTTIPYFILMPVSIMAANGTPFTTDIALVGGLIMTFRAVSKIDLTSTKEFADEKL